MKKSIIFLLLTVCSLNSSDYLIKMGTNSLNNIVIIEKFIDPTIIYNEKGFKSDGIHKDTGTIYDLEGYDIDGFNENNQGKQVCDFSVSSPRTYHFTINEGNNNKGWFWKGELLLAYYSSTGTLNNKNYTLSSGEMGYFTWSYSYGSGSTSRYSYAGICMTPLRN